MHSEKHGETTFHFNSDMSGKAVIVNDNGGFEVEAKDLISFISKRAKDKYSQYDDERGQ